MSEDIVDITGLSHGAVLAALYNASRPLGMGHLEYDPTPMSVETAADTIAYVTQSDRTSGAYFDYLIGRVMKVMIPSSTQPQVIDAALYDRDNGAGTAARVIARLRDKLKEGGDKP